MPKQNQYNVVLSNQLPIDILLSVWEMLEEKHGMITPSNAEDALVVQIPPNKKPRAFFMDLCTKKLLFSTRMHNNHLNDSASAWCVAPAKLRPAYLHTNP